jgi:hypothetical protein
MVSLLLTSRLVILGWESDIEGSLEEATKVWAAQNSRMGGSTGGVATVFKAPSGISRGLVKALTIPLDLHPVVASGFCE